MAEMRARHAVDSHEQKDFELEEVKARHEHAVDSHEQKDFELEEVKARHEHAVDYHEQKDFELEEVKARGMMRVEEQRRHMNKTKDVGDGGEEGEEEEVSCSDAMEREMHSWEAFHVLHSTARFFKERRYLVRAFPELMDATTTRRVLEVGCGSGSSCVALLKARDDLILTAIDYSKAAVSLAEHNVAACGGAQLMQRFSAHVCDIVRDIPPTPHQRDRDQWKTQEREKEANNTTTERVSMMAPTACVYYDVAMMVFTLSAIPREHAVAALRHVASVLRPNGGVLVLRDYGQYDMAMLRFKPERCVIPGEVYRRYDGTLARFMTLELLEELARATEGDLHFQSGKYITIRLENRKTKQIMHRVFVEARFVRPGVTADVL